MGAYMLFFTEYCKGLLQGPFLFSLLSSEPAPPPTPPLPLLFVQRYVSLEAFFKSERSTHGTTTLHKVPNQPPIGQVSAVKWPNLGTLTNKYIKFLRVDLTVINRVGFTYENDLRTRVLFCAYLPSIDRIPRLVVNCPIVYFVL